MGETISVIITTYNRKWEVLKRALESVLGQTYSNIEILIINDNPYNKSLRQEIETKIKQYNDNRISYYCMDKNRGACYARNYGIKRSKGKYIAFLDDDDEWLPEKLEKQYGKMKKSDNIGLVYCNFLMIDKRRKIRHKKSKIENDILVKMLEGNKIGSTSFPLIKKECFRTCGGFDTKLESCQDWDMWLRIIKKYKVAFCQEFLGTYYIGNDGITADNKKRTQGWDFIIRKYIMDYVNHPEAMVKYMKDIIKYCQDDVYHMLKYQLLTYLFLLLSKLQGLSNKLKQEKI